MKNNKEDESEENNKQDGEIVSEDCKGEDERKSGRTMQGGVREEGGPGRTQGKNEKADSAYRVKKNI